MPYIYFTDEQKLRANSVDLERYLLQNGEELIRSGPEKRLKSDKSITIRGSEWFDHAQAVKTGGGPVAFVMYHYGLSYPEAMIRLLGGEQGVVYEASPRKKEPEPKEFALPPAGESMRRVYAYLLKQRFISREVLNAFVSQRLIYESCEKSKDNTKEYHNAVFVGSTNTASLVMPINAGSTPMGKVIGAMSADVTLDTASTGPVQVTGSMCSRLPLICFPFSPYIRRTGKSTAMWRSAGPLNTPCSGCWNKTLKSGRWLSVWTTTRRASRPAASMRIPSVREG